MRTKYQIRQRQICFFFQVQNAPKPVFDRGSAPDPAGGAYDAPQTLAGEHWQNQMGRW